MNHIPEFRPGGLLSENNEGEECIVSKKEQTEVTPSIIETMTDWRFAAIDKSISKQMNNLLKAITSKFSLSGSTITFTNKGVSITGRVIKNENGYSVTIDGEHNLSDKKKTGLEKRMRDWYYFTQVKKGK